MKVWNGIIAAFFIIALAACGGQSEEENPNVPTGGDSSMTDEWSFSVDAQQVDDKLNIDMYVRNDSDEEQTLVFPSAQEYEIVLVNSEDEEVFRYSDTHMFAQNIVEKTFQPGEQIDRKEPIPLDNIPAGTYMLTVELTVSPEIVENLEDPNTFIHTEEIDISESN